MYVSTLTFDPDFMCMSEIKVQRSQKKFSMVCVSVCSYVCTVPDNKNFMNFMTGLLVAIDSPEVQIRTYICVCALTFVNVTMFTSFMSSTYIHTYIHTYVPTFVCMHVSIFQVIHELHELHALHELHELKVQ